MVLAKAIRFQLYFYAEGIFLKVRFIINPKAGSSRKLKGINGLVRDALGKEAGIFEVRATNGAGSAAALSREARDKAYEFVFACGGDGTINEVATQLVGTRTALGIIPAGSGNALARTLNIPSEPSEAIGLLKKGSVMNIDVGVASGRYFFSTAGFAFEALLSKRYNEGSITKKVRGIAPYYALALVEYLRFRPERMGLEVDGREFNIEPLLLTVANTGQWGANAFISPGAKVDDGLLDFCVVPKGGILKTLEFGYRVTRGSVERYKGFQCIRGKEALIKGRKATYAHVDGEPFEATGDQKISILPGALSVLAPAQRV